MPHKKPARIWTQAEKNHLQDLLQERHDEGRYWKDRRTSRKFLTKKMNEVFPPRGQPGGQVFFVRHVNEYLRQWVGNHPDPRQVEIPDSETDSEEEGGGEEDDDDDDDDDDDGGREAVSDEAPEEQGEDEQGSQGAQDAGDQDEEGEDGDTDEERGRRREWRAGGKSSAAEARKANKKLPKREQ
ncbi:uncharacterized protein EAE98_012002 [Botrytis deweyae]|uniref:Myb-like domain-containing protein n=1 Tax=Botrytis deweyae TaxID=2478750 RepID=A0ABQ7I4F3_9HELO|nr:uncharacterized protein EAE98_012002 [Botrytis deweyae]KAF7911532.1 hypothetical protein EAE98_012002 [Botrytis deweyae]